MRTVHAHSGLQRYKYILIWYSGGHKEKHIMSVLLNKMVFFSVNIQFYNRKSKNMFYLYR